MAMDATEQAIFVEALEEIGAMTIVIGAMLAIMRQEIPDFKMRAMTTLSSAATGPSAVSGALGASLDAKRILSKASRVFAGL